MNQRYIGSLDRAKIRELTLQHVRTPDLVLRPPTPFAI
jgi:hypothetical protein